MQGHRLNGVILGWRPTECIILGVKLSPGEWCSRAGDSRLDLEGLAVCMPRLVGRYQRGELVRHVEVVVLLEGTLEKNGRRAAGLVLAGNEEPRVAQVGGAKLLILVHCIASGIFERRGAGWVR